MAFWGYGLYANDCAADVKDTYVSLLQNGLDDEEVYAQMLEEFKEYLGTEEEPLFWYALADIQWQKGRLRSEVKQKALFWINNNGGLDFWMDSANKGTGWKNTLLKLQTRLNTPQPPLKKVHRPKCFPKNPWNIGDIYAYQFDSNEALKKDIVGKYIVLQKIGNTKFLDGNILSRIQVFDKLFESLPCIDEIQNIRVLPLIPNYDIDINNYEDFYDCCSASMYMYRLSDYPSSSLTFIGSKHIEKDNLYPFEFRWENLDWESLGDSLCEFYLAWHDKSF